jgi:nuclear GTP-binding protein
LITSAQGADGEDDEDEDEDEDEEEDAKLRKQIARDVDEDEYLENPGVLPVYGRRPVNPVTASTKQKGKQVEVESEEEEDIPDLIDIELPTLQAALDRSDVVVEVLDARDPIGFRSQFLEQTILLGEESSSSKAKNVWRDKLVILLNKIDLVPKEVAEAWLKFLRNAFPGSEVEGGKGNVRVSLFKASFVETPIKPGMTVYGLAKGETSLPPRAIPAGIPVGREGLLSLFAKWSKEKKGSEPLNVVFVGHPNVGKSAVINTLLGKPSLLTAPTLPSSNGVGPTTKVPAELALKATDGEVRLIDTPGWEFNPPDVENDDEDMEDEASDEEDGKWAVLEEMVARDMLTRNMGRIDKVKDTLPLGTFRLFRFGAGESSDRLELLFARLYE